MKSILLGTCINLLFLTTIAAASYGQNPSQVPCSLKADKEEVKVILEKIEKQTGYSFLMVDPQGNAMLNQKISFTSQQSNLAAVLAQLKKLAGLEFTIKAKKIIVKKIAAKQQSGSISGKVMDNKGEPLPGTNIKVLETGKVLQSKVDGSYHLNLASGNYTLEFSYLSFQTKRVTGVVVEAGKPVTLDVVLKPASNALQQVTVTGTYKNESVAGLYARQKNAASVTDGLSAEQISRTPDNNMGQVLKRVSGVTTVDNKYVVVRGMTDRYNQAMIDGIVLPSTNMNKRNFSFDALPQEMVSNVVVNKTATPDVSSEFSGGQVSVNTLDIPTSNFTVLTAGTAVNTQTTGKQFLMLGERHALDFIGFDNGARKEPANMQAWYWHNQVNLPPPGIPGQTDDLMLTPDGKKPYSSLDALAQSRRVSAEGLKMHGYQARPYQNFSLGIGRVYDLRKDIRFGFVGGASLRNKQEIVEFNNVRGQEPLHNFIDSASAVQRGSGTSYRFSTALGAVLNAGLQGRTFKIAVKNMYSRLFDDNFNEARRLHYRDLTLKPKHEMFQEPQVTAVWQHKLEGEQLLPAALKLTYSGGLTRIGQQVLDQRRLTQRFTATIGGIDYYQSPDIASGGQAGVSGLETNYRMWTDVKENDFNWNVALARNFGKGSDFSTLAKIGYSGWDKHRTLGITQLTPYTTGGAVIDAPYHQVLDPAQMGTDPGKAYYYVDLLNGPTFEGRMRMTALYAMLDQHFFSKLRLVYGLRTEYYNLANRQNDYLSRRFGELPDYYNEFATTGEKDWRFLPSINATYAINPDMNVRAAYSQTVIRPDFRETAYFGFYDYELDANISGRQLVSTKVDNLDLRYEWYPRPGEVVSVSGFYKTFQNPIELIFVQEGQYRFQNQHAAVNYGVELEFRKSLDFIADKQWLRRLTLFGNGSLVKSKVEIQSQPMPADIAEGKVTERLPSQDRPLYGQSPWIINAGIDYQANRFGLTASYNRSGPRSFTIHYDPNAVEFENGRNLLDLQVRGSFLKQKAELRLNLGNLLDEWRIFYRNVTAYEQVPGDNGNPAYKLTNGTNNYEKDKGDIISYRNRNGRTISLAFTYKF